MTSIHSNKLLQLTKAYAKKKIFRSILQLALTLVCLLLSFALSILMLHYSVILLILSVLMTAAFTLRSFVILHDCCHYSYFESKRANHIIGNILGVITLTPFSYWRRCHLNHHSSSGNLDKRGLGDIRTLTVKEYLNLNMKQRLLYRIYRHPLILFVVGPFLFFFIHQRLTHRLPKSWKKEKNNVYLTNTALAFLIGFIFFVFGWKVLCFIYFPSMAIAATAGIWLFYVQHQFPEAYWQSEKNWSYIDAAIKGSTFYKLPKLLHWVSANIGYHHIHHLNPKVPNYALAKCFKENKNLQQVNSVSFRASFSFMRLRLWDEESGRMITFKELECLGGVLC